MLLESANPVVVLPDPLLVCLSPAPCAWWKRVFPPPFLRSRHTANCFCLRIYVHTYFPPPTVCAYISAFDRTAPTGVASYRSSPLRLLAASRYDISSQSPTIVVDHPTESYDRCRPFNRLGSSTAHAFGLLSLNPGTIRFVL